MWWAGTVGEFGVFFVDDRDTVAYIPLDEEQTNIRGELPASLRAPEGHWPAERSLFCPNSLFLDCERGAGVGAAGGGCTKAKRPISHRDTWETILNIMEWLGEQAKWPHAPSHIDIS